MEEQKESDVGPTGIAKTRKAEEIITGRENMTETKLEDRSDTFRSNIKGLNADAIPPVTPTSHLKTSTADEKGEDYKGSKSTARPTGQEDKKSKSGSEQGKSASR